MAAGDTGDGLTSLLGAFAIFTVHPGKKGVVTDPSAHA
jgi:hypothetical protein